LVKIPHPVLDDALSAVDSETEQIIQRNCCCAKAMPRPSFIRTAYGVSMADRIVVLEHGRIAQIGSHKQLIEEPGVYRRIWLIQHPLEQEAI
jgi:ATP-binding cassette subfamily B protein